MLRGEEAAGSHMWLRVEAEKEESPRARATPRQADDELEIEYSSQFTPITTQRIHHITLTMANYLASIFGTEQDKVNCSFYYKIGACRHGDRCSRKHVKPSYSQTILLPNLYQNPAYDPKSKMNPQQLQNHFDAFYEDFWCEMCKYGEIEEVVVCDNNNDHLIGNVYARFKYEESAQAACDALNSRWYAGRPIYCELSPVTDFREACCRLNSGEGCVRGGFCNFIHRKDPSPELDREIELATKKWLRQRGRDEKSASRSPTPEPSRKRF
ncbi:putative U2 auxiliary factor small subunit [Aureobasidium pullulans]|nr:putative U2 auxiliary factor small subunit [Aureobasidium pullulans]